MNKKCKICGRKIREIFQAKFKIKYHYCDYCSFISKDENDLITRDEELKIYNNHNNSIEDPRYVAFFKQFLSKAVLRFCNGKKGLDFGSGPSPVLAMILERNYGFSMDIYDLYYSPEEIYKGKTYDLITSTEVFEHIPNPLEYFSTFKQCMKKDSILSMMTLFHPEDENEFLNWYYMRDMSHISFFTPQTMKVIGELVGMKIIYTDNTRYTTFKLL
ncbi:MAG: class I SAM-dependent methyltransferase [Kosmotogaceae bacterium]